MNYVRSKIDNNVPPGYNQNSYLFLMNKKVLSIIMPIIRDDMNSSMQNNKVINESKNQESHLFDPMVINRGNPASILPPPKAQSELKSTLSFEKQFSELQSNRDELYPKKKSIDFSDKNNFEKGNIDVLYANALKEREEKLEQAAMHPMNAEFNKQQRSLGNFAVSQNEMNSAIESISNLNIEMENDTMSTPIINLNEKRENNPKPVSIVEKFTSSNISSLDRNNGNVVISNNSNPKNVILPASNDLNSPSILEAHNSSSGKYFSLPDSITSRSKEIILPPKLNTTNKDFYITIDSHNRDLEAYPNPNYFQVKFSPTSNSRSINAMYDSENNIIYEAKTLIFGDDGGASLSRTYDNVLEIQCLGAILPLAPTWVAGTVPYDFDDRLNYKWTAGNGKIITLLNEPYILLTIDELRGTYEATNTPSSNAFAKLISTTSFGNTSDEFASSFMSLKTSGPHETYKYNPTTLGKIDKLTLGLFKRNGLHYPVGIDKLYISKFSMHNEKIDTGFCETSSNLTVININLNHYEYGKECNELENKRSCQLQTTGIVPGDLLYFYDTTPDDGQIIRFHKNVQLYTLDKYEKAYNKDDNCDFLSTDEPVIDNKNSTIEKYPFQDKDYVKITARICTEKDLLDEDESDSESEDNTKECTDDGLKNKIKFIDFQKIFPVNTSKNSSYLDGRILNDY